MHKKKINRKKLKVKEEISSQNNKQRRQVRETGATNELIKV